MREHPLDGEMGFACVGGAEHRCDASAARLRAKRASRRKRQSHYASKLGGATLQAISPPSLCITMRRHSSTRIKLRNESGTNRARIADSVAVQIRSRPDFGELLARDTRSGIREVFSGFYSSSKVNAGLSGHSLQESRFPIVFWCHSPTHG